MYLTKELNRNLRIDRVPHCVQLNDTGDAHPLARLRRRVRTDFEA
jgi:hypothetical protein